MQIDEIKRECAEYAQSIGQPERAVEFYAEALSEATAALRVILPAAWFRDTPTMPDRTERY